MRSQVGDPLPVVLVTLGLFYIVNAIAGDVWNFQARVFPPVLQRFPTWMPGIGGERFFTEACGSLKRSLNGISAASARICPE